MLQTKTLEPMVEVRSESFKFCRTLVAKGRNTWTLGDVLIELLVQNAEFTLFRGVSERSLIRALSFKLDKPDESVISWLFSSFQKWGEPLGCCSEEQKKKWQFHVTSVNLATFYLA